MLIVPPDFDRRIDLPGAGPCPRPVDIDRAKADLRALVSLRIYSFAEGVAIDGEAEGDEVFVVLMRGAADVAVDQGGARAGAFALRVGEGPRAVYLPPHASYRLSAVADCDIAYARCEPIAGISSAVRGFAAVQGRLDVADHAGGMELTLAPAPAGSRQAVTATLGRSPERLLHVRSTGGTARVRGERLGDWTSAIFTDGEVAVAEIEGDGVELLLVSAAAR